MRLLRCLAALGALSLPTLSQESGTIAAENDARPELRAVRPPAIRGPCVVPMPNLAKRPVFGLLRPGQRFGQPGPNPREPELPLIPPPTGRFAFREIPTPAPPCDEVGLLQQPLLMPGRDRGLRPEAEPKAEPKPKQKP